MILLAVTLYMTVANGTHHVIAMSKTTKSTAVYTMKKYSKKFKGDKVSAIYRYDLPILKGNTKNVKKINVSLEKEYRKTFNEKDALLKIAKEHNKEKDANVHNYSDTYRNTHICKVTYNQNGYISFRYKNVSYIGGAINQWTSGYTYSLKTGKKLDILNVTSGGENSVKAKIGEKLADYVKKFSGSDIAFDKAMKDEEISEFEFYLINGKVVVCFGPYVDGIGNGEAKVILKGNY